MRLEQATIQRMSKKPATYDDLLRAPEGLVAELIDGELHLTPRPAEPHGMAAMELTLSLGPRFHRGGGGWVFRVEPELWLGQPDARSLVLVPDLSAWRDTRFPHGTRAAGLEVAPDWVCEVLSPSTARHDRLVKLDRYAAAGVSHAWLVDPEARTVEAFTLRDRVYARVGSGMDDDVVHLEPFEALGLLLSDLWGRGAEE